MSPDAITAPAQPAILVIPPDAGRALAAFGSTGVFKLEGTHTGGTLCLVLGETPPGVGPPPHVHRRDDELFIILEGELSFLTATGWVPVTPGTAVYIPRGAPHTFRNTGATPSRHWALTFPSGFEHFYAQAAELFAAGPLNPERLRALATEHGYEILPPVPPPGGRGTVGAPTRA